MEPNKFVAMVPHRIEGPEVIFSWSWQFMKTHWKKLYTIAIIPVACVSLADFIVQFDTSLFTISVALYILAVIVGIAMLPALIKAIHETTNDPKSSETISKRYSIGFSFFWTILWLFVLKFFISIGSTVLFVIPGFIISIYTLMFVHSAVLGGKKGFTSFIDSFNLVRGRWWAVLARLMFLGIVIECIYFVVMFPIIILSILFATLHVTIIANIVGTIASLLLIPFVIVFCLSYMYRLYVLLLQNPLPQSQAPIKGWLVAFFVIGIPTLIGSIALLGFLFSHFRPPMSLNSFNQNMSSNPYIYSVYPSIASVGNTITIKGYNFSPLNNVMGTDSPTIVRISNNGESAILWSGDITSGGKTTPLEDQISLKLPSKVGTVSLLPGQYIITVEVAGRGVSNSEILNIQSETL